MSGHGTRSLDFNLIPVVQILSRNLLIKGIHASWYIIFAIKLNIVDGFYNMFQSLRLNNSFVIKIKHVL